jgi:hypothetical protein
MALRLSQGLRNGLCGASGMKTLLDGGYIRIYTGSQPTAPEGAETGTLLTTIFTSTNGTGGLTWGTASSGAISKNAGQWVGTCGTAGVAGWFRCYGVPIFSGTDGAGTSVRFDGDIGTVTGDLKLSSTTLAASVPVILDTVTVTIAQNQS